MQGFVCEAPQYATYVNSAVKRFGCRFEGCCEAKGQGDKGLRDAIHGNGAHPSSLARRHIWIILMVMILIIISSSKKKNIVVVNKS